MILQTRIETERLRERIGPGDKIVTLGSCFSDSIGTRLASTGFDVLQNPFGTLYNPASIAASVERLDSGTPFTADDLVETPSDGFASFSHHSSFNRPSAEEFLDNANRSLAEASAFFREARWVALTFGTAFVFRHVLRDVIVSNCHKLPAAEFRREFLSIGECVALIQKTISSHHEKRWVLTVSPIRHLSDGAHCNTLSKSTLLLAVDKVLGCDPSAAYFPAYEIMNDELRDYRFYDAAMTHPTEQAADYIFERFTDFAIDPSCRGRMDETLRENRRAAHRPLIKRT